MREKIMLVDGNSILNRAFFAVPLLTNKNGIYVNGVYGFFNILLKLIDEETPDYIGIAFDLPKPTFRHIKYPEYKGTRKKMSDELREQIPILKELLKKMEIKIFELEGFEADDILGTLSVKTSLQNLQTTIISGDRDLLQLATETVKIRIPKTKGAKTEIEDYFKDDVFEKYGVTPKEFIEVKALMGDTSDNIPGVPSIGEKTAIKIISEYKTLENAFEHLEDIKPKKASENMEKFKEQAFLSKELVTISLSAPIEFDKNEVSTKNMFNKEAFDEFKKHDFKSFYNRFSITTTKENLNFNYIDNDEKAKEFLDNLKDNEVCFKIIFDENKLLGLTISSNSTNGTFIYIDNEYTFTKISQNFFENNIEKVVHNAKNDIIFLTKLNIIPNNIVFDTMISAYILNATRNSYNINDIADEYLNKNIPSEEDILGKGKSKTTLSDFKNPDNLSFVCNQSYIPFCTKPLILEKLNENNQLSLYYDIEHPLIFVLASMEIYGIKIDKNKLLEYQEELGLKLDALTKEIYFLAGEEFNINSPKQLSIILFEKLGLKGGKKTRTGWSTSADVLEKLKDKDIIINKIIEYRTYSKLKSTYADGLLAVIDKDSNKIHSTFNQTITSTGRISSSDPNLQNIPIKIELGHRLRKVFIPEDGYTFVDADYSQIELRILAHLANDEVLIKCFNENLDIHKTTASQVFNTDFDEVTPTQRSSAKAVNFGIIYGKHAFSLSEELGISVKDADFYINNYFKKYPKIKNFLDETISTAKEKGYTSTIFNRLRYIPEINASNFIQRSSGERIAMNMPIQGAAADIMKIAMIKVYNRINEENLKSRLILQVHDELLIEAHNDEIETIYKILKDEMENCVKLSVPLDIDINRGSSWYDTK